MKTQNNFTLRFSNSLTSMAPLIAIVIFCFIFSNNLLAQTKSGNSELASKGMEEVTPIRPPGLPQTQFEISTLAHLRWLSEGDGTADTVNTKRRYWHYVLTADIDASETKYWNVDDHDFDDETPDVPMGFYPIGHFHSTPTRFQGSFDGKGHTISNLYIYHQTMSGDHAGLFGSVESNFHIRNIILSNVDFTCKYGGALVSRLHKGDIDNCHSSGTIKASWGGIGGLIGEISYIPKVSLVVIENCSSSCNIETFSVNNTGTSDVGGFIGNLYAYHHDKVFASIRNCSASGMVTGHSRSTSIGGFAGSMSDSLYIENCNATGDVTGAADVGGFVGVSGGVLVTIKNCHTSGEVTAISETSNKFRIGGFIGNLGSWTTIEQCSATGKKVVASEEHESVGGFVGAFSGTPNCLTTIKNSFTLCDVNGESYIGGFLGDGSGQAYSVLRIQDCYSKGNVNALNNYIGGFAGRSPEFVINCVAYGNVLSSGGKNIGGFYGTGTGTKTEKCYAYGDEVIGGNSTGGFAGACNTDTVYNCHSNQTTVTGTERVGGFCGDLSNLSITKFCSAIAQTKGTGDYVGGFVGITGSNIQNSEATGSVYTQGNYVGGFIGAQNNGTTTQCNAMGSVRGNNRVGGFAGQGNKMVQCFAAGSTTGNDYVAGFAGSGSVYANDCFASGSVHSNGNYGSGFNNEGEITNSYTSSQISGSSENKAGLVGRISRSASSSCYFDSTYNSNLQGTADGRNLNEHKGLLTEQFSNKNIFKDWDFNSIWQLGTISQIDMYPRPYHQWYMNKNTEAIPFTSLQIENQMSETETGHIQNSIRIIMPYNYDITSLALEFELQEGTVLVINDSVQISGVTLNDFSQPVICYFVTLAAKSAVSGQADSANEAQMWMIEVENEKYQVAFNHTQGGQVLGDTLQYIQKDSSTTEVLALPGTGYMFSEWLDESGNSFSKDSLLVINDIIENGNYTALFELKTSVQNLKEGSFKCYPLPCHNSLSVQFTKQYEGKLEILSISGVKVKEVNIKNARSETIDVSALPQGMYMIRVGNECMKIVKQ